MINLFNGMWLERDQYQYILKQERPVKDNKTGEVKKVKRTIGFYSKLLDALEAARDELPKRKFAEERFELQEAINVIIECDAALSSAIDGFIKEFKKKAEKE